jgi:hypothetical protein
LGAGAVLLKQLAIFRTQAVAQSCNLRLQFTVGEKRSGPHGVEEKIGHIGLEIQVEIVHAPSAGRIECSGNEGIEECRASGEADSRKFGWESGCKRGGAGEVGDVDVKNGLRMEIYFAGVIVVPYIARNGAFEVQ